MVNPKKAVKAAAAKSSPGSAVDPDHTGQKKKASASKNLFVGRTYKCGECTEGVDDTSGSIMCNRWRTWYHSLCTDLDSDEYSILTRGKEIIAFVCEECLKQTGEKHKKSNEINSKLDTIMEMFVSFKRDIVKSVDEKIDEAVKSIDEKIAEGIDKKINEKLDDFDKKVEQKMKDIEQNLHENIVRKAEEKEEIEKRKKNIIFIQLPESSKEKREDRQADDIKSAHDLLKQVVDLEINEISEPLRLGKKDDKGRNRPLKITLKSVEKKTEILRNYWPIINEKGKDHKKRVFINPDLTQIEREEERILREQLREERKNNPNQDLVIREIRGKKQIVELQRRGPPRTGSSNAAGHQYWLNNDKVNSVNKQEFLLCYTNADQLFNKRNELKYLASEKEPDIIHITEVLPKIRKI